MKKTILSIILAILCVAGAFCAIYYPNSNINKVIDETQNIVTEELKKEVTVTEYAQLEASDTKDITLKGEDVSTKEIIESSEIEEQEITDEGALEKDAKIEQENISYDGDITGNGLSLLGSYQGLTYYSQADSRWASIMYSSIGDRSQTMKSSACGPTSASMVVSSSKGAILPTTMASLAVSNGYRTANNGTAWAYYSFVADYFDFKEYYSTSNFDKAIDYLKKGYYVIVSCGSGLFTTGGHYIVLVADNDGIITVYDPYLYNGKFETASRRNAGAIVSGNSVYVSESSFKQYANYKNFWIFSNDNGNGNLSNNLTSSNTANYIRYVATQSANLNVRNAPAGNVVDSLKKGTQVTIYEVQGDWSKIGEGQWVSSLYLSSSPVIAEVKTQSQTYTTSVGSYYRLKNKTNIYSKSNLTGVAYSYLAQTQIKVLSHASSNVDYIQVIKTGRKGYINKSAYSTLATTKQTVSNQSSVNTKRKIKACTLYSKSNLTGIRYTYKSNTTVTIIKTISNNVDYIKVNATGRYAYINVNNYK